MKRLAIIIILWIGLIANCFCQADPASPLKPVVEDKNVGGPCEACDAIYQDIPKTLSWDSVIANHHEHGEPLEIKGKIFQSDGKTPAANVILYIYHTDNKGLYSPTENLTGSARRHGHLRGWVQTNLNGEYRFRTIKPVAYPDGSEPAHIHPIIKEPDKNEYYIDDYLFDDDPLLTNQKRARLENRGGSGIIHLSKENDGLLKGYRDITLGLNIPHYNR